jgi:poly [ADP-ribose] polymerase 2/3/4
MATLKRKVTLVCSDGVGEIDGVQHNKVWHGELYDDNKVITRWGRIGYDLQSKEFPNVGEAFLEKKIAEKKSGKKGYTEFKGIDVTGTVAPSTAPVVQTNLHEVARSQIKTSSNPQLEQLIARLVRSNVHKITSNTSITLNDSTGLFMTPLGVVTPEAITDARNLLADAYPFVKRGDFSDALIGIVSKYLRLIPQNIGMKFDVHRILPDVDAIRKQEDILQSLEASYKAITAPKNQKNQTTKTEQVFDVELDVLKDGKEIDRLIGWFNNGNHRTHGYSNARIVNFFKVKIGDNWRSFNNRLGNNKEIWHGTGEGNLLSVLKTGLKTSPPSTALITGKMFGHGHYGAIDSSKSLQYTFGRFGGSAGSSGWLMVGDFAMGNTYFIRSYGGHKPHGYDSIWAKKENTGLRFDELIVPSDNQVRIKYLLEIK